MRNSLPFTLAWIFICVLGYIFEKTFIGTTNHVEFLAGFVILVIAYAGATLFEALLHPEDRKRQNQSHS